MADNIKIKTGNEPVGTFQTFFVCKVIVMDRALDSCQLFTTLNKYHLTDLGLTDTYLDIKTRYFPGKLFATNGVFYLATEPAEELERVSCRSCSGEEQITFNYMNDLELVIIDTWIVYFQRMTIVP